MNNQHLYFLSFDTTDTRARTQVLETINRAGRALERENGMLVWTDRDFVSFQADINQISGIGSADLIPVDQTNYSRVGGLSGQVEQFVKNIRAA